MNHPASVIVPVPNAQFLHVRAVCGACNRDHAESGPDQARAWLMAHACADCPDCDGLGSVPSRSGYQRTGCLSCGGSGSA